MTHGDGGDTISKEVGVESFNIPLTQRLRCLNSLFLLHISWMFFSQFIVNTSAYKHFRHFKSSLSLFVLLLTYLVEDTFNISKSLYLFTDFGVFIYAFFLTVAVCGSQIVSIIFIFEIGILVTKEVKRFVTYFHLYIRMVYRIFESITKCFGQTLKMVWYSSIH